MCTDVDVDWRELPTVELADELDRRYRRLTASEAAWLAGVAEFDRRLGWQVLGFRSAAAWLSRTTGMTMATAKEKLRVARVLADGILPTVGEALGAGRISYAAARALTRLPEADAKTEAALVRAAEAGVPASRLEQVARQVRANLDRDGADGEALDRYLEGGLWLTRAMGNGVVGTLQLDAEDGDLLYAAIDSVLPADTAAGNPVVPVDTAESTDGARCPVDSRESTGEPAITPARRRADALMTLVRAGLDHLETNHPGRPRTELLVILDSDGTALTASGAPLTEGQTERASCDATLRRVVLRGRGEVLDVRTRTRHFSPAMRAGAFARDRGCRFPGCGRWWGIQLHHVKHFRSDGPTSVANRAYLCRPHHRLVHEGGWTVTGDANATLWFTPPDSRPPIPSDPPFRLGSAGVREGPTIRLDRRPLCLS